MYSPYGAVVGLQCVNVILPFHIRFLLDALYLSFIKAVDYDVVKTQKLCLARI